VAFAGAVSLLLLLLCMELLLQFGARISTSQMVSSTTRLGGLSFENMLKEKARSISRPTMAPKNRGGSLA
jgi:hypothetical protein